MMDTTTLEQRHEIYTIAYDLFNDDRERRRELNSRLVTKIYKLEGMCHFIGMGIIKVLGDIDNNIWLNDMPEFINIRPNGDDTTCHYWWSVLIDDTNRDVAFKAIIEQTKT